LKLRGGTFLKWTGDGFLAWFETPLHRELPERTRSLLEAVWHLTFTVNTTQLGSSPTKNFRLRHGVAYEHDALLTTIARSAKHKSLDITGRAVVLAFRLSGIPAPFPGLVADATIAKAAKGAGFDAIHLKSWEPSAEDWLRYFKGQAWGTRGIAISEQRKRRPSSLRSVVNKSDRHIRLVEENVRARAGEGTFSERYTHALSHGPEWAKVALAEESLFIERDMLGSLKALNAQIKNHIRAAKA